MKIYSPHTKHLFSERNTPYRRDLLYGPRGDSISSYWIEAENVEFCFVKGRVFFEVVLDWFFVENKKQFPLEAVITQSDLLADLEELHLHQIHNINLIAPSGTVGYGKVFKGVW